MILFVPRGLNPHSVLFSFANSLIGWDSILNQAFVLVRQKMKSVAVGSLLFDNKLMRLHHFFFIMVKGVDVAPVLFFVAGTSHSFS